MTDRIIISFDDENEINSSNAENPVKPDINLNPKNDNEIHHTHREENNYIESVVNCFYKSNPLSNNYYNSEFKFPEGLEKGFNLNYSLDLNDEFFSSVIYNNRNLILTSCSSKIYLIDRIKHEKRVSFFIENHIFEKTGCVIDNDIYLNSLSSVIYIDDKNQSVSDNIKILYNSAQGYYIWTNLNYFMGNIVFSEFNPSDNNAVIKVIDRNTGEVNYEYKFRSYKYLSDTILAGKDKLFIFYDNSILQLHFQDGKINALEDISLDFEVSPDSNFIIIKNKLYFNNTDGEILYIDLSKQNNVVHYSGIKTSHINSLAGFDDYLITGNLSGWQLHDTNGNLVFSHIDIEENKIEAMNKSVLVVSKSNKIYFHNLNRFQEAEGFVVFPTMSNKSKIISSIISENNIHILTRNGILESYSGNRLNIHL